MGYRKVPTIYTLEYTGQYEGLVVRMKSAPLGKVRQMMRALDRDDDDTGEGLSSIDMVIDLLVEHLVSWNLEDEDGTPIPAGADGLNAMELDFVLDLSNRYMSEISGPSEELGKGSPSGALFPGAPLTMEAL